MFMYIVTWGSSVLGEVNDGRVIFSDNWNI